MSRLVRGAAALALGLLLAGSIDLGPAAQSGDGRRLPERPRVRVEVPPILVPGRTIRVPAGGDLQDALDEATPGDLIALEPGATYRGPFRLRNKTGTGWIVIASAARDLPPPGRRVTPAEASRMPKLVASSGPVFETEPGAHHYRLVGLEITSEAGTSLTTLVQLGADESSAGDLPHHLIIDRCFVHGDARLGGRRGVALNASHAAVVDSHFADFKERSVDAQAIAGWNGPGPFRISGNYLEASGETVMFGGADPEIADLVPADIEVTRNHMAKPLRWKKDDPAFEGTAWAVKNLFELKNASRVLVDGNLFEYNWPHAQNGFAILFTVRNQDGGAPWSVVEDVTFTNNVVRHVAAGINMLGRDDNHPSRQTRRIVIRNNVFLDVGDRWGHGRLFQLLDGTHAVTIEHNTARHTGSLLFGGEHAPHTHFVFRDNLALHNEYGITGSGTGPGNPTLDRYFPGAAFRGNVIVGAESSVYPDGNFYPASLEEAGRSARDDGREPGADTDAVNQALGGLATVGQGLTSRLPTAQPPGEVGVAVVGAGAVGVGASGVGRATEFVFWASLLLIAYVYVGYPLVAVLRARWRPRPSVRAPIEPSVSIVVVAHNEAERIAARIENVLALDYPADRLDVVVASDGSTDGTVDCARRYERAGVTVRPFATRRGKAAVLNAVVPGVRSDIVLFADARQYFDRGALRAIVENFADPSVGAVSGELMLTTTVGTAAAGHGTAFYWRYEKVIRAAEARADSTVGATGAIYAIRRELFEPIPDDTLLDDVLVPLRVIRKGFRVLFEPGARAYDGVSATAAQEFARKARTVAGTFQLFARERWLFHPLMNRLWFETISHKALRLALPGLHAALLLATLVLAAQWPYQWALAIQLMFYAAALVGYTRREARRRSFVFSVPCAICLLGVATVVGFVRFLTRRQPVTWERVVSPSLSSKGV